MGNEFDYIGPGGYYQPMIIQNAPMYQNGSMMVTQQIYSKALSINLKKFDYFPGETIEGTVVFQNQTNLILSDILVSLFMTQGWNVLDEMPQSQYENPLISNVYIGIAKLLKINLPPNNNLINLNPGTFNLPFKLKLPLNMQPSLEYPINEERGYLRYYLKVQLVSPYVKGENNMYLFIKTKFRLFKYPYIFTSSPKVKKLGMIDQGSTTLKVSYQNYNYQIGTQIPFDVEIDNSRGKSKVKSVDVKLIRRVQYKRAYDNKIIYNFETVINSKSFAVNVPNNTVSQKFNYVMEIKDNTMHKFNYMGNMNPYPKLANFFYALPSTYSKIIRCEYFMVVKLDFSGLITKGYLPKVVLPIVLNHDPEKEKQEGINEDEDMKKAIEASLEDMNKIDDINVINVKEEKDEKNENNEIKNENDDDNNINNEKNDEIKLDNDNNNEENNNNINEIKENNNNINNINNIINEKPEDDKDINNPTLFNGQNNDKPNNFSINDFDEDNESIINKAETKKKNKFSLFD